MATQIKTIILLVDDDADDRLLFSSAVAELGDNLHCVCVSGTLDALSYLNNAEPLPDFIFLDLNMPGYDGKKCLRQIKASERLQNIPVIIYSTFISQADKDEMTRFGANRVVTKPGDFNELLAAIVESMQSGKTD
jgi:CheY-like chemotaxis protein